MAIASLMLIVIGFYVFALSFMYVMAATSVNYFDKAKKQIISISLSAGLILIALGLMLLKLV